MYAFQSSPCLASTLGRNKELKVGVGCRSSKEEAPQEKALPLPFMSLGGIMVDSGERGKGSIKLYVRQKV